uniref:Uncharacterized protein n=1 Tax=Anguilla anguilla TaxID=7936 RepID=A0A0E9V5R4_ANGAN
MGNITCALVFLVSVHYEGRTLKICQKFKMKQKIKNGL